MRADYMSPMGEEQTGQSFQVWKKSVATVFCIKHKTCASNCQWQLLSYNCEGRQRLVERHSEPLTSFRLVVTEQRP
jgi:hypothetical protein